MEPNPPDGSELDPRDQAVAQILSNIVRDAPPEPQRRMWFSIGMLLLAPVCLLIGMYPWPGFTEGDRLMWAGFAGVLLLVAGWQFDKAIKERNRKPFASAETTEPDDPTSPRRRFHVVRKR